MSKWRNSFPVRASRRMHENRGKACPVCGQSDPLLLVEDGRCANCASHTIEENHHILGKAFRNSKEAQQAVEAVSPNAHRLLSDLQAGHPIPPVSDPYPWFFIEASVLELILSMAEMWVVLNYTNENHEMIQDFPIAITFLFFLWSLTHINQLDLFRIIDRAKMKLHEKKP